MEPLSLPLAAWLAGAVGLIGGGAWFARRPRAAAPAPLLAEPLPEGQIRRIELRMEAMEGLQADVLAKLEAVGDDGAAERRLQAMASRILGLVRDKDASLDTALAGLDQLRARLRVLEQMGDLAETRGLFEEQGARLEAMAARLAGLEAATPPFAELADQMTRLYGQRDAMAETVFARLAPIETKQRELEVALALRDPGEALDRLGERLEALRAAQEAADQNLRAAQEAADRNLQAAQEAALESLRAAQETAVENLRAVQEAAMTGLGERLGARLDGFARAAEARLAALERVESPQAELVERLAALHAQKEAGLEAALGRLAPVEARVAELEAAFAARDPRAALDQLAERLEALLLLQEGTAEDLHAAQEASIQGLRAAQEAAINNLRAAQEAAATALDGRLGGRLEGLSAAQAAGFAAADSRLAALEGPQSPQAKLAERLAALHAQKEAGLEAALGRLAPVEARVAQIERGLASWDAKGALDQLAAELSRAGERLAALEAAGSDAEAEAARLEAQAIAAQMVAARTVAEETRIFANRLSLLEASLPRLSIAQALMMQALERQAAPPSAAVWPLVEGMAEAPSHLAAVEAPAPETRRGVWPVPVSKG